MSRVDRLKARQERIAPPPRERPRVAERMEVGGGGGSGTVPMPFDWVVVTDPNDGVTVTVRRVRYVNSDQPVAGEVEPYGETMTAHVPPGWVPLPNTLEAMANTAAATGSTQLGHRFCVCKRHADGSLEPTMQWPDSVENPDPNNETV